MIMFKHKAQYRNSDLGFTLLEVLIAAAILAIFFLSSMSLLVLNRYLSHKTMEEAIMHDFAIHYLELARNQPFNSIAPGQAINTLFDGSNGTPNIRFPDDNNWYSLLNNDYLTFHPDLSWFAERNPEICCQISTQMNGTTPRGKTIKLGLRWDAPLKHGPKLSITFTSDVYANFN